MKRIKVTQSPSQAEILDVTFRDFYELGKETARKVYGA